MFTIPSKFRPLLVAVAVIAVSYAGVFLADLFDIGEPAVSDCCANGVDAPEPAS